MSSYAFYSRVYTKSFHVTQYGLIAGQIEHVEILGVDARVATTSSSRITNNFHFRCVALVSRARAKFGGFNVRGNPLTYFVTAQIRNTLVSPYTSPLRRDITRSDW